MSILIIGGDSRLSKRLSLIYPDSYVTTRRNHSLSKKRLYLELSDSSNFQIPEDVTECLIIGGPVSYNDSENDKEKTEYIHKVQLPNLLSKLLKKNIFTLYISTNMVFGSTANYRKEGSATCPEIEYGVVKAECEKILHDQAINLKLETLFCILRLTKHLSPETSPFGSWINAYRNGDHIKPFTDLYFSPLYYEASAQLIKKIISNKPSGILHYSGNRDISYSEFALLLRDVLIKNGFPELKITPWTSKDAGINILYKHHITLLEMERTRDILSTKPLDINESIKYLSSHFILSLK